MSEVNCSTRKLNYWQRLLYNYLTCPKCQSKARKIDWVYEPGWKCTNEECEHIIWEELPNERNAQESQA